MALVIRIFFLLLLLWLPMSAYSDGLEPIPDSQPKEMGITKPSPSKNAKQSATTSKKNSASGKTGAPINQPKNYRDDSREKQPSSYEKANLDVQIQLAKATDKMANLTFCLVVFGAVQIIIFIATTLITNKAANAAKKSADLQETSILRTERAYIVAKVPDFKPLGNGFRVSVVVRNAGKTYGTVDRLVCRLRQYPIGNLPAKPNYSGFFQTFPQLPIDELPVKIGYDEIATPRLLADHDLFFLGYFEYTDIFDKTHYTRFCWLVHQFTNPPSFIRAGGKRYNNTDDATPE